MENEKYNGELDRLVSGLHRKEPVLRDPEELTDKIMLAIQKVPRVPVQSSRKHGVIILQRLVAAASIVLFLVFGFEQYRVVDKVGKLEMQNAAIAQNSDYSSALLLHKVVSYAQSDPSLLVSYKRLQGEQENKLILLKTAILFDVLVLTENKSIHQNPKK